MTVCFRRWLLGSLLIMVAAVSGVGAQIAPTSFQVLLPAVVTTPPPQPFGVNIPSALTSPETVALGQALNPRWSHGSSISWALIEPQPGVYDWDALAGIERALAQLRVAGIEPIVLVTDSPSWARKYPDWVCSPPSSQSMGAFVKFLELLSARYREGASAVGYWEVWNEPDGFHETIPKNESGIGCWAERNRPVESGQSYGAMLKQAAAAIKRGNTNAQVIGGALTYWTADDYTVGFLDGMIASGGVDAVDILSFHAYGQDANDDWLLIKATRLRQQLAATGRGAKPLLATEVGAPCPQGINSSVCNPGTVTGTEFVTMIQPRYAAHIPAESLALGLLGSIWYPLVNQSPGFAYSHVVDIDGDQLVPRPAYFALRNAIWLLQGATYIGPPLTQATGDAVRGVHVLPFQRTDSQLYVIWAHQSDVSGTVQLPIPAGAHLTCWEHLEAQSSTVTDCTPVDGGTILTRTVGPDPQYVEVRT